MADVAHQVEAAAIGQVDENSAKPRDTTLGVSHRRDVLAQLGATGRRSPSPILCCGTFDGATDSETFVSYVAELALHLRPGQVVAMDNLPAHRSPLVDELAEAAGAYVLRLPPYSPDLNPMEMAISKVKALLRRAETRTVEALQRAIAEALAAVTARDAANYIRHSGYGGTFS